MPMNTEALKDSVNGHKPQAKPPHANPEQQQQRLADLEQQTLTAIASLTQTGINAINAQVVAFDARLTRFERRTARAMADRLKQSQLRIQHYLVEELSAPLAPPTDLADLIDAALNVPDLTGDFLAIAHTSVAGCLPL